MMFRKENPIMLQCVAVALVVLATALSGCGPTPPPIPTATLPPPAVALVVNPNITEVLAGQTVALIAETSGKDLRFKWSADRGKLSAFDEPAIFYTAPDSAGVDTVAVEVNSSSGTTIKGVSFKVIVPDTPTPTATLTNTPILTPTPSPNAVIVAPVNLRNGPGVAYDIISTLSPGQVLTVTGRIADSTWLRVNTKQIREGWVINLAELVTLNLPIEQIPIASPPPAPTPPLAPTEAPTLASTVASPPAPTPPPTEAPPPIPTATPPPPPMCLITEPADGDENLGFENEVRVTCSDVPDSLYIWILVYSHHDFKYYPQPGPIGSGSGQRRGTAYLGTSTEGIGDKYGIIVALANESVSVKLRQDAESYSGYVALPDGVEEKNRITVRRGSTFATPLSGLEDPSFEDSGLITPPWWHWGWPPSDDGGTRDPDATDCVHSGNQALKITRDTPDPEKWAGNVVMQEVPFNAGRILRFYAWLKILELSKGEAYVELIFASDDAELQKYTGDKYKSTSQDWTQIGVQGIAPKSTTKAKLFLVVGYEPEGWGVVCFDDMSVSVQ